MKRLEIPFRTPLPVRGFTLIELLVTVAIVAILAAIAYPSYSAQIMKSRRADGREMLLRVAAAQERFYTTRNAYTNTLSELGINSGDSESRYYVITSAAGPVAAGGTPPATQQTYVLTATPQGAQAADKCVNLTLSNAGERDYSGPHPSTNGNCW